MEHQRKGENLKFTIDKQELNSILDVVTTALATNPTTPVLGGVNFIAENGKIVVQATDLDNSCSIEANANISENGSTVLPGSLLHSIVKTLENKPVTVEVKDAKAHITCGQASFTTNTLNTDEFPAFPGIQSDAQIEIPITEFQTMLKKAIPSVAKNEAKGVFTGVQFEVKDSKIRATATDSYRVSITENKCESTSEFSVVIPPKFLVKLSTLNSSEENVTLAYNQNQVIVKTGEVTFICRKLSGAYPNVDQLINPNNETVVVLDRSILTTAIKRVSVLQDENTPVSLEVKQDGNTLRVSVSNNMAGDAVEEVSADCAGNDCKVGFDVNYLLDGLNGVDTGKVHIVIPSQNQPAHIHPCDDEGAASNAKETDDNMFEKGYLYLIMPVLS